VKVGGRHSALGDAITTAGIYLALVPRLRDRGIRTFAEARHASLELVERRRAGSSTTAESAPKHPDTAPQAEMPLRIDVRMYSERAGSIMSAPPHVVAAGTSIGDALGAMERSRVSSVFVSAGQGAMLPKETGILTERDVLRAISAHGARALAMPVDAVMSRPLLTVSSEEFAYKAVARMNRLRVRHLGVTDATGHVIGALSARDLLRLRAESSTELGDEIELAGDSRELARAWSKLPQVAAGLVQEGLAARQVAALISRRCCELTARAAAMAEQQMNSEGRGPPPAAFALLVLGSAGRGESLLAMDQDNALVFADDAPEGADGWFEGLATRVADILHEAGVPYCKGGVMAKNPPWRGTLQVWKERIDRWIDRSNPQDLLSVDIFFDLHAVHGVSAFAGSLIGYALDRARGRAGFAKLLMEASGPIESPLNWFGRIRTTEGRIDLKRAGLFGIVRSVRALAINRHIAAVSTLSRIEAIKAEIGASERDLDALAEAQDVFLDLILRQQLADIEAGRPPGNAVEVRRLSWRERERLRTALQGVEHLGEMTQSLLFAR
jgi:DNA polymerase-3 subunit epsilon/CBS domain-containing protein